MTVARPWFRTRGGIIHREKRHPAHGGGGGRGGGRGGSWTGAPGFGHGGGAGAGGPFTHEVVNVALNTSTGTQDITVPGMGDPKAAIFVLSKATVADGSVAHNALGSFGMTDGSEQCVVSWGSKHSTGLTEEMRRGTTDSVLLFINTDTGAVETEAAFDSWITDGVRINISNRDVTTAYLLTVVLLGGDNLEADLQIVKGPASGASKTVTTSFEPSAVIGASHETAFDDTSYTDAIVSLGVVSWDGVSIGQNSFKYHALDDKGTSNTSIFGELRDDAFITLLAGNNTKRYLSAESFTSTGFDIAATNLDFSGIDIGMLILGGVNAHAEVIDSPTSTGDQAYTGAGFEPSLGVMFPTMNTAVNTYNNAAGSFGVSTFDGSNEYCTSWANQDNVSTSNTQSEVDAQAISLDNDGGGDAMEATLSSFDADGITLNYSLADGTARKIGALYLG